MPKVYRQGTSDENVIKEILEKKAYRKKKIGFDVSPDDVWLDGGAQIGVFAEYAAIKGCKKVVCYEPEESNFKLLQTNCQDLQLKYGSEFILKNRAIENKSGEGFLTVAPNTWRHSLQTHYKKPLPKQKVVCDSFSGILKSNTDINAVKLDIEGSELEILHSRQDFSGVRKLVFEYSFTKNRDMIYFFECVSNLESSGFNVHFPPSYKNQKHNGTSNQWGGFVDDIVFCTRK
tara:strand:- start:5325 stop:6020 length:696 start_codon:yes stop_codon:yes gene_type:complete